MPRYFFHLYDDVVVRDEEGQELLDDAAARQMGMRSARQMASAQVLEGHLNLDHRIEVADESDTILTTVMFKDVVVVRG